MNRERWIQIVALLVVGGAVWLTASTRFVRANRDVVAADAGGSGRGTPTRVMAVNPRTDDLIRIVRLTAEVKPWRETHVYAQVAGAVSSDPIEVGTRLAGGAALLTLGVPEVDAALDSAAKRILGAKASAEQAAAAVLESETGITGAKVSVMQAEVRAKKARGMIAAAEAEVIRAKATVRTSGAIYERLAAARAKSPNLVSPEKVDLAMGDFEVAKANLTVAEIGIDAAKDNFEVARASIEAAKARVTAAEKHVEAVKASQGAADAGVAQATAQQGETQATKGLATITAPYDCVVVERMVDVGQVVRDARRNSGAKALYRVLDDNKLRIRFYLSSPDCPMVRVGNMVRITFDEYPDWPTIEAPVSRIADGFDGKTLQMEAEVDLWNLFEVDGKVANLDTSGKFALPTEPTAAMKADGKRMLRAATLARVTVDLETRKGVMMVPVACVKTKKQKSWVMIVTSENIVRKKTVKIGASDGHRIEIVLPPPGDKDSYRMGTSDRVISKGSALVSDGETADAEVKEW